MTARLLVIGASGILAPAAASLAASGDVVVGVARRGTVPDGVTGVHVDATTAPALAEALGVDPFDAAIVYGPAVTDASMQAIRDVVAGRLVLVRTSAAADPALGPLEVPADTLQLGWRDEPDGSVRWHTPDEVSAAALEVLADGRSRALGALRPWDRRP